MKIDVATGALLFPNGTIAAGLNRSEFVKSLLGTNSSEDVMGGEWTHYELEPEPGIRCTVSFDADRLDHVFVSIAIPSDEARQWSEAHELERKSLHDSWLLTEIGNPPYEFPWGKVVSDYDNRGPSSEIIIRYDNSQ